MTSATCKSSVLPPKTSNKHTCPGFGSSASSKARRLSAEWLRMMVTIIRHQLQEQKRQRDVGRPPDGLSQRQGAVGGQFHDQPFGQRLQRAVVFLLGEVRTDRLTARDDDSAPSGGCRGRPARTLDITALPHSIRTIVPLDRGLLARLVLGPDIAAIDRETAIPIQRHEDASARNLDRVVDQGPLFERFHRHLELTEPGIDLLIRFPIAALETNETQGGTSMQCTRAFNETNERIKRSYLGSGLVLAS